MIALRGRSRGHGVEHTDDVYYSTIEFAHLLSKTRLDSLIFLPKLVWIRSSFIQNSSGFAHILSKLIDILLIDSKL